MKKCAALLLAFLLVFTMIPAVSPASYAAATDISADLKKWGSGAESWKNHSGYPTYKMNTDASPQHVTQFLIGIKKTRITEFNNAGITYTIESSKDGNFIPMDWKGGHFELKITDLVGKIAKISCDPATQFAVDNDYTFFRFETCEAGLIIEKNNVYTVEITVVADSGKTWTGTIGSLSWGGTVSGIYCGGELVKEDTFDTSSLYEHPPVVQLIHYHTGANSSDFEKYSTIEHCLILSVPLSEVISRNDTNAGRKIVAKINGETYTGVINSTYDFTVNMLVRLDLKWTEDDFQALTPGKYYAAEIKFYDGDRLLFTGLADVRNGGLSSSQMTSNSTETVTLDGGNSTYGTWKSEAANAVAESKPATGMCGDELTWKQYRDGDLIIAGCGDMYDKDTAHPLWEDHAGEVGAVTFHANITSIGESAFEGCTALTEITVPEGVVTIGDHAFSGCTALTKLTLPSTLECVGEGAFNGVRSVDSLCLADLESWCAVETNDYWASPLVSAGHVYVDGVELTELNEENLPAGITEIKPYTFTGMSGLTSVTLPDSVKKIGEGAFLDCDHITNLSIGKAATVDAGAFYGCDGLTEVLLGDDVTSLGEQAFANCTGLTSVKLRDSVTTLGAGCFNGCTSLASLTFCGEEDVWNTLKGNNALTDVDVLFHEGEWKTDRDADCENDGSRSRTCTVCAEEETETISATGHSYPNDWTTDQAPTCTDPGEKSKTCETCGAKETETIDATGHKFETKTTPATCTGEGEQHEECSVCKEKQNEKTLPATGHSYPDTWTEKTAATCTDAGEEYRTCQTCQTEETREIAAKGHSYGDWITDKEATRDEDGSKHRDCQNCDESETAVIPRLGYLLGDVDEDGEVTDADRVYLSKALAGWEGYDLAAILPGFADLNGDGAVTSIDRMILTRHCANWIGYEDLEDLDL